MEIKTVRGKRSLNLIANFIDGYASGWRFAVPDAFRDALDIKWTARMIPKTDNTGNVVLNNKGKPITIENYSWTQGEPPDFDFKPGSILYDTRLAYELNWLDALKHMKLSVQIANAIPFETLTFKLYRPKKDFSAVEEIEIIECAQENFVAFLKTGILTTSNGESRNLFKEYEN